MAVISLYSIPEMDMTYQHVPYFGDKVSQHQWFLNKRERTIEAKISVDPNRTSVTLDMTYQEIERLNIDYVSLQDPSDKTLFYFVADYDYVTTGVTTLLLVLDVMQTYMFDFKLKESFVDRCHVDRWTTVSGQTYPTTQTIPEGIDFGENIPIETTLVKSLKDNYLLVAANPLGMVGNRRATGGSDTPSEDCWKEGKVSANLFRMAKGYEGFGPYKYYDSGGVETIGYGTTAGDKKAWQELIQSQPCKEARAAELAYESFNKEYGKSILDVVIKDLKVDSQQKFDALADLAYNAGPGRVTRGDLYNILKQYPNDETKVRPVWETWIIRDQYGVIQDGLIARRKSECDMYFKGIYEKRNIYIVSGPDKNKIMKENGGDGWLPPECEGGKPEGGKFFAYGYEWFTPTVGEVTSTYYRQDPPGKFHGAIDIGCPIGTPVRATRDGKVVLADGTSDPNGYGNYIIIEHEKEKLRTWYAHNSELKVKVGQTVTQGQVIALSGNSGRSGGPHLHYELRKSPYVKGDYYKGKGDNLEPIPGMKVGDKI